MSARDDTMRALGVWAWAAVAGVLVTVALGAPPGLLAAVVGGGWFGLVSARGRDARRTRRRVRVVEDDPAA